MKIDIGIPTYRRPDGLVRAIESAVAERAGSADVRIFVANNDPADDLSGLANRYPIEVITHPVNLGPMGNWNKVIELARAPYLVILHDDDLLLPGRIARGIASLEADRSAAMSFCAVEIADSDNRVTRIYRPFDHARRFAGLDGAVQLLHDFVPVRAPGVMFRIEPLRAAGGYDVPSAEVGDIELYLTLILRSAAIYDEHIGARYRFDTGNLTHGVMFKPRDLELYERVRSELVRECTERGFSRSPLDASLDRMIARHMVLAALYRLKVNDTATARACLEPVVRGDFAGAGRFRSIARALKAASHVRASGRLYDVLRAVQEAKRSLAGRG